MPKTVIDLTGRKFSRLTISSFGGMKKGQALWRVRCECGTEKIVRGTNIKSGRTKSCGCYNKAVAGEQSITHGLSRSPTYKTWSGMLQRCHNKNNSRFKDYGARNITVCERWEKFENFLQDMGPRPLGRLTIERIDNEQGYYPDNCRWATYLEQGQNTRKTRLLFHDGLTLSMSAWGRKKGILRATISRRLRSNCSTDKALRPVKKCQGKSV